MCPVASYPRKLRGHAQVDGPRLRTGGEGGGVSSLVSQISETDSPTPRTLRVLAKGCCQVCGVEPGDLLVSRYVLCQGNDG